MARPGRQPAFRACCRHDVVLVEAGDTVPGDGQVIAGVASWTKAPSPANPPRSSASPAATSRRSPAAPGCCPTGFVRITADLGESFDRMIAMVEGAKRQKTPNELALTILLVGLTVVFLLVVATLMPFSIYLVARRWRRRRHHHHRAGGAAGLPGSPPPSAACCRPSAWRA